MTSCRGSGVLTDNNFVREKPGFAVILEPDMPGGTHSDVLGPDTDEIRGFLIQVNGIVLQERPLFSIVLVHSLQIANLLEIRAIV